MTLDLTLDAIETPIGEMLIVVDAAGALRALDWREYEPRMRRLLRLHYGEGGFRLTGGAAPQPVRRALESYFSGDLAAIDALPTAAGGTAFQRAVWAALREIPVGQTWSYSGLAAHIGRPKAVRAVGLANGSNPVGLVGPCHRVIGANGSLTGYGGGMERKRWLLEHEGAARSRRAA
jgi:methylated-DNA-[protein]-cysteine S-methyltransferase